MSAETVTPLRPDGKDDDDFGPTAKPREVTLGHQNLYVYPQKIGRLESRVGRIFAAVLKSAQEGVEIASVHQLLFHHGYELMEALYPKLMPEHEFRGFPTVEAWEAHKGGDEDAYKDDYDKSPDFPEILHAYTVAVKVNRFDVFGSLGKMLPKDALEQVWNQYTARQALKALAEMDESDGPSSATESSTTTPLTTSTDSGTSPPTPTDTTDSPSQD